MTTTLRDFIATRRAEITKQIKELKNELSELNAAYDAISPRDDEEEDTVGQIKPGTIKDRIMTVLKDSPTGLDANQIIDEVKRRFDLEVPRNSMSPQLSRLKRDGFLMLDGVIWKIPGLGDASNLVHVHIGKRL